MLARTRLGPVTYESQDVLVMPFGLVGFGTLHHFLLAEGPTVDWLLSLEEPAFGLPLIDPTLVEPTYAPPLDEVLARHPGCHPPSVRVRTVLIAPSPPAPMRTNLMAPVVVLPAERTAYQLVLWDQNYPNAVELPPPVARQLTRAG